MIGLVSPLVTILMPNHNGEQFIARAIDSVLAQSFRNFEFLIIEDASTDHSREIINGFDDPRIRVIQLEKNGHICNALNTGLAEAKGKYIARIDSDDRWLTDKLERQVDYLEADSACGGCFTWVNVVDENDAIVEDSFFNSQFHTYNCSQWEWIRRFFFEGCRVCHPSAVIPREVFEKLGYYDLCYVQIQDFDMWIRIAKHYPLHVIEEPLMNYRFVEGGNNVSAASPAVEARTNCEFSLVLSRYLDDLSDEEFVRCFRNDFVRPEASSHEELACERALLLIKPLFCGTVAKLGGILKLQALLNDCRYREVLSRKYGVDQMNFYQLTASPVFYQPAPPSMMPFGRKALLKEIIDRTFGRGGAGAQ